MPSLQRIQILFQNFFRKQNYYLLRELVKTDFKLRYQGSVLGYLWSLLRPLALFTVLYIVFALFFRLGKDVPHFPAYLLLGIVLWTYFAEATAIGMRAITDKGDLIRKVNVPKYIIVLATSFSAFVNLLLNLLVVGFFIVFTGADVQLLATTVLPLLLFELLLFSGAVSFILAALYVRFKDIAYIWDLGLQVLFYATPVIYPMSMVPERFTKIIMLNPMAQILQDARSVLVTPQTVTITEVHVWPVSLVPFVIVLAVLVLAVAYFRKESKTFAENI